MADYAHLRHLEAKATPGPFRIERRDFSDGTITYIVHAASDVAWFSEDVNDNARVDAQHYVAARNALPGLLDEHARMKAERDESREQLSCLQRYYSSDTTIEERDHMHEQIDAIADALGDETEWSNLNDRGDNAIELAAALVKERDEARAEVARLRTAIETVALLDDVDCGDSGCGFARQKRGMRTNGGCRCIERARPGVRPKILKLVRALRAALGTDHE